MATETLFVWLYDQHVATLERRRGTLSLTYTDAARSRFGLGHPLISLSLPVALRPHRSRVVERFFAGLLPEGQLRRTLAYDFRIAETDTFGLLREIGRDCAGALVVLPASDGPPPSTTLTAEPISDEEVAGRIANLARFPLGADAKVRVSLAGTQDKLLLVRTDRGWALPTDVPSTHILKPAISQLPDSVENEAFCMNLARRAGLRAATVRIERFGGKPVLVVERFDRTLLSDGQIRRVHQEDVNQALGIDVGRKYESAGGPSLRQVAKLLTDWRAPAGDLLELLRTITFVVAVGDADHHAKNVTVLHDEDGSIHLAPLYDVMCTRHYPWVTAEPGMFVNDKRDIDDVQVEDLIAEGVSWGLRADAAEGVVAGVLRALPAAVEDEAATSRWASAELLHALRRRVAAFAEEATHLAVPIASAVLPDPVPRTAGPSAAFGQRPDRTWVHPYRRDDGTPVRGHWRYTR